MVYDGAQILSPDDEAEIVEAVREFRKNMGAPLRVATFAGLEKKVGIDRLGADLFKSWGMGKEGLLLVVSKRERKAHVELGEDLRRIFEKPVREVMAAEIVPAMKKGDYRTALVAGAADLASLGEGAKGGEASPGGPPAAAFLPQKAQGAEPRAGVDATVILRIVAALLTVAALGALAWGRLRKTA